MKIGSAKKTVSTDPVAVKEFLSRGLENVFPGREALEKALLSGRRLSIYFGIDPTGPTLHIGHAIPLMKLSALQKMGHEIILLIGDFTAMIGDPTDKMAARKPLSRTEVLNNCKLYKKQASVFLSFSGKNSARLVYNSKWLAKMNFSDVVKLASNFTVQQMLERDMFEKRVSEGKPIHIHEFLYPLMQGYDSVAMDVDGEIGGNDQTFNMLAGRDLMKSLKNKDKLVIATRLLVDPSGKKMGKTEGNMITLLDSPADMFGKVMSWPDTLIISGFELCTRVSAADIEKEKKFLEGGGNPRDAKIRLGRALVSIYHGDAEADKAAQSFTQAFSQGAMPSDAPEVNVSKGASLAAILVEEKIIASKSEYRRLMQEGAIKAILSDGKGQPLSSDVVEGDLDLKIGKHRFIKLKVR